MSSGITLIQPHARTLIQSLVSSDAWGWFDITQIGLVHDLHLGIGQGGTKPTDSIRHCYGKTTSKEMQP
jgi:hypothetical protein